MDRQTIRIKVLKLWCHNVAFSSLISKLAGEGCRKWAKETDKWNTAKETQNAHYWQSEKTKNRQQDIMPYFLSGQP